MCYNYTGEYMREISKTNRNISIDLLRIVACIMVICIHTASTNLWYTLPVQSISWKVMHFYDFFCRSSVPIFFMISGALFLSKKEMSIKKIYSKYILRLFVIYVVFEVLYAIDSSKSLNPQNFIPHMLISKQHLWYLRSIIGVYIGIPILKKISENKKILEYSLILFFCFGIFLPSLNEISYILGSNSLRFINNFNITTFSYAGYFLLGYYLSQNNIIKYKKRTLFIMFILTNGVFSILSSYYGTNAVFYSYFSLSTFLGAIFLFQIFKNLKLNLSNKITKIIEFVSSNTLGIYLVHIYILEHFISITGFDLTSNTIIKLPLVIIIVFTTSFILTSLFKKIIKEGKKMIKKYIK